MSGGNHTVEKVEGCLKSLPVAVSGSSLIVGLSGGSDSVALLLILNELMVKYDFTLTAVHIDHGIRPGESRRRDLDFCRKLTDDLGIPFVFYSENIPKLAAKQHRSLEEAGRIRRYELFEEVRSEHKADYIVTAHHLDDQEETILLHLLRGCGLKGLCGMESYDAERKLIRPLLGLRKAELEAYLAEQGQSFVTDETNLEDGAVRNRIRHQVLPAIRKAVPEYSGGNLAGNTELFREMEQDFTDRANTWIDTHLVKEDDGELVIRLWDSPKEEPTPALKSYIVRECIRRASGSAVNVGEIHLSQIRDLMGKETGKMQPWPGGGRVIRSYNTLIFRADGSAGDSRRNEEASGCSVEGDGNDSFDEGGEKGHSRTVTLREATREERDIFHANPGCFSQNTCVQYVDYDKIFGSLWIRSRREGDVFATGKDGNRKKLKGVLIDLKVPARERDELLLVGCGENEVIWIVGKRLSPYYFVGPDTERVGRLEIAERPDEEPETFESTGKE